MLGCPVAPVVLLVLDGLRLLPAAHDVDVLVAIRAGLGVLDGRLEVLDLLAVLRRGVDDDDRRDVPDDLDLLDVVVERAELDRAALDQRPVLADPVPRRGVLVGR